MDICDFNERYNNNQYVNILEEMLSKKPWIAVKLRGKSMHPTIKDGERVYIKKISEPLHKNAIVMVKAKEHCYVHRIIFKQGKTIVTKGDNNLEPDNAVHPSSIIAEIIPFGFWKRIWRFVLLILRKFTQFLWHISKTIYKQIGNYK